MKRSYPHFSFFSYTATAIFLGVLGLATWRSGGRAFSPGQLTDHGSQLAPLEGFSSHAAFENQCRRCHQPLQTTQDVLCIACHTDIGEQIQTKNGTHAQIEAVNQCAACHSDHKGLQFDPVADALPNFNHDRTQFSLILHQVNFNATPMDCAACHALQPHFTLTTSSCRDCHGEHDAAFMLRHTREFGEDCQACHDGLDQMSNFDHSKTSFPLDGKHAQVECDKCHQNVNPASAQVALAAFKDAPTECQGCHEDPQVHLGLFPQDCAACHTAQAWTPATLDNQSFNHMSQTSFSLDRHAKDYQGQAITCASCHRNDIRNFDMQTCIVCHSQGSEREAFMREHQGKFGSACLDCHDGVDRMQDFDHATVFVLDGRHADIECEACHQDKVYKGVPKECVKCHAEPKIHAGFFGLQCQYCHTAQKWSPANLRIHPFLLDHGSPTNLDCKTCHIDRYTEYTCYICHDHQPGPIQESHQKLEISPEELPNCATCHPTGVKGEAKSSH
jgi:hypothetical protein